MTDSNNENFLKRLLAEACSEVNKPKTAFERIGFGSLNNLEIDQRIRTEQVHKNILKNLKNELNVSEEFLLSLIGISQTTVSRRKMLKSDEAGKVYRIAKILSLTEDVLGSHEKGVQWLKAPAIFLEGKKPIELLQTEAGAEEVKNLLLRIENSVYS